MYKRVIISKHGPPSVLQVIEDHLPALQSDEVRIRVEAAGVGNPDVLMREGVYPGAPKPPYTPGYDVTGRIEAIGEGVTSVAVGDTVVALVENGVGGYSECVQLQAEQVMPAPAEVDATVRVSLVLNYLTAYQMLHRIARVMPGEALLVHGASGGVGTALLQLGRHAGLDLYGTASAHKHELLHRYGTTAIDYHTEDFVQRIQAMTDGGVDVVVDPIGGMNYRRSFEALRPGGRLVAYGFQTAIKGGRRSAMGFLSGFLRQPRFSPLSLLDTSKGVFGYGVNNRPDWHRNDLNTLFDLLQDGAIDPVIAERVPLHQAHLAHERLGAGDVCGKIVLTIQQA